MRSVPAPVGTFRTDVLGDLLVRLEAQELRDQALVDQPEFDDVLAHLLIIWPKASDAHSQLHSGRDRLEIYTFDGEHFRSSSVTATFLKSSTRSSDSSSEPWREHPYAHAIRLSDAAMSIIGAPSPFPRAGAG